MNLSDRDHARLRSRLDAFAYGLLDPDAADAIRAHLVTCAECRARAESLALSSPGDEPAGAHLPESLVVRWAKRSPQLRGLQREMVRRHLERCDLCREDLRLLGHEAELRIVPELEVSDDVRRLLVPQPPPPRRQSWFERLWSAWPQTGWAVAATAMLAVVVFNPSLVQRLPWNARHEAAPAPTEPTPTPATHATPSPSIASGLVLEPIERSRGVSGTVPVATIGPGRTIVWLKAGPPDVPLDSDVRVEVREAGGAVRVATTMPARDLARGRILALELGRDARPGVDTLVVAGERVGRTKTTRYLFEVRIGTK